MSPRRPTSRWVIAAWAITTVVVVVATVITVEALRFQHPLAGPQTPEVDTADTVDPLREIVECPTFEDGEGESFETAIPTDSNSLYDCPQVWDQHWVIYTGEAIGAVLTRGETAWVQLNDDVYAHTVGPLPTHRDFRGGNAGVGVHLNIDAAQMIDHVGGPGRQGDLVEVVGVFHQHDSATAEVAIIQAEEVRVVRDGELFEQPSVKNRYVVATIAVVIACIVTLLERRVRRNRPPS